MTAATRRPTSAESRAEREAERQAGTWSGRAWSCTVRLVVTDRRALRAGVDDLTALLDRVDAVASRFRPDSALSRANALAGRPVPVPPLLVQLVDAGLRAATLTGGAVDPTLGRAMAGIGYDRDIDLVRGGDATPAAPVAGGPWWRVRLHRDLGLLTVPAGTALDLGATAKAWTADHAARTIAQRYGTGVLLELGGDLAVAGPRDGGWTVRVAEREGADGQLVTVGRGGLATSTTTVRTWTQGSEPRHHVVDPRTGLPVDGPWRSASVHAPSTYEANIASTAALVLGAQAVDWLIAQGFAARLVGRDGSVATTPGWPGSATPARRARGTGISVPLTSGARR